MRRLVVRVHPPQFFLRSQARRRCAARESTGGAASPPPPLRLRATSRAREVLAAVVEPQDGLSASGNKSARYRFAKTLVLPALSHAITSYGVLPFPIPGASTGIPGTASPVIFGRSARIFFTRSAGTCPSMTYAPTSAVWHDSSFAGTPDDRLMPERSFISTTAAEKPWPSMYFTQSLQQPQDAVL